ncbi:MAG TPA: hypothetical protein VGN26_03895 [Armatimonadota bacterium]
MAQATPATLERLQLALESTDGTAVQPTNRLLGMTVTLEPDIPVVEVEEDGSKAAVDTIIGKEETGGTYNGKAAGFNELAYVLSSLLCSPVVSAASGGVTAKQHEFLPSQSDPDAYKTFTAGLGSSAHASRVSGLTFNDLKIELTRQAISLSGKLLARKLLDGLRVQNVWITGSPTGGTFTLSYGGQTSAGIAYNAAAAAVKSALEALTTVGAGNVNVLGPLGGPWSIELAGTLANTTATAITANGATLTGGTSPGVSVGYCLDGITPTRIAFVPLPPKAISVKMGTALNNMAALSNVLSVSLQVGSRRQGIYYLNASESYDDTVELHGKPTAQIVVPKSGSTDAYLNNLRAGDLLYFEVTVTGPTADGTATYSFQWTMPCSVSKQSRGDTDNLKTYAYDLVSLYDGPASSTALGGFLRVRINSMLQAVA